MVDAKYWVWFSAIPKIGSRKCMQLLEHFTNPINVWGATRGELEKLPFLNGEAVSQLLNKKLRAEAEKHLENIEKCKIEILAIDDDAYPYYLRNIYDPPIVLYVKGKLEKEEKFIAVVGSRRASSYGLSNADTISSELARLGITVVSGLARGIDSRAHTAALKADGRTVAVLGCGLDIAYPPENSDLMERIICSGAIVSEYVPGTPPLPQNFPARNRIISGISLGVVVVEAGEKSGSLITADFALEQGREVFAIPGNISNFNSKGTNKLIKDGAKIVTSIDDILEELCSSLQIYDKVTNPNKIGRINKLKDLDNEEMQIVRQLEIEPVHIDLLSKNSGLGMNIVNSVLVILEMKGIIEQLPGKVFMMKE